MIKKNKPEDLTFLRLKKSTVKKLRNWKMAIQEAHGRRYSWDEFLDICLFDLEIIDILGAEIYEEFYGEEAETNKKFAKLPKQIVEYIRGNGYEPEELTREEIIEMIKEYREKVESGS